MTTDGLVVDNQVTEHFRMPAPPAVTPEVPAPAVLPLSALVVGADRPYPRIRRRGGPGADEYRSGPGNDRIGSNEGVDLFCGVADLGQNLPRVLPLVRAGAADRG